MSASLSLLIPLEKIAKYLLDVNHPDGGPKARFFISHGFDQTRPFELADALAEHALAGWPGALVASPAGIKHQISGPMTMPDGTGPMVRSVWLETTGVVDARFVTALPRA